MQIKKRSVKMLTILLQSLWTIISHQKMLNAQFTPIPLLVLLYALTWLLATIINKENSVPLPVQRQTASDRSGISQTLIHLFLFLLVVCLNHLCNSTRSGLQQLVAPTFLPETVFTVPRGASCFKMNDSNVYIDGTFSIYNQGSEHLNNDPMSQ